jgi:hypothetical protein
MILVGTFIYATEGVVKKAVELAGRPPSFSTSVAFKRVKVVYFDALL